MTYWLSRRSLYWVILVSGVGLVMFGLLLTLEFPAFTQATPDNIIVGEFIGTRECRSCHRDVAGSHTDSAHALALIDAGQKPDNLLGDFAQENPLLSFTFPQTDSPRPITVEDIAYAIGAGNHVQRYLIETGENAYAVLPIEWVTETQTWQVFDLGETWTPEAYDWNANCAYCHVTGYDAEALTWQEDGVQCEACHGAGETHVELVDDMGFNMSAEDYALVRDSINIAVSAEVCGQCHSRGVDILTGLPYPVSYAPGADLSAGFTLAPMNDSIHWWKSGHANQTNMQFNEWAISAHATAFETLPAESREDPQCLTCHSEGFRRGQRVLAADEGAIITPIDEAHRLSAGVTCSTCHDVHPKDTDATTTSAYLRAPAENLCVECHSNGALDGIHHPTVELFEGHTLISEVNGVPTTHSTDPDGPNCVTCHMMDMPTGEEMRISHALSPVLPGIAAADQPDTCTSCHQDLTRTYGQRFITKHQEDVSRRLLMIYDALEKKSDVPEWVQNAALFVEGDGSFGVHNPAYTDSLLDRAELELGLNMPYLTLNTTPLVDPVDCAECHANEHREWLASPHANASLLPEFTETYANSGRPSYCLRCHASGYDPLNQSYAFDGVICTSCHIMESGTEHPPAPINIGKDAKICGTCHSGGHASVYEEWLASEHARSGIDCIDCHTPHDNGLMLGTVNATCGDCHAEAMQDEVHMGQDMICTDCHMTPRETIIDPTVPTRTGHTMHIDPGVCADCHGKTHVLSLTTSRDETVQLEIDTLNREVERLAITADENLTSGLLGGVIGVLLVFGLIFLVLRVGRAR